VHRHDVAPPDHATAPPDHATLAHRHAVAPPDDAASRHDHDVAPPDHDVAPPDHPTAEHRDAIAVHRHAPAPPDHPTAPPDHPTAPPDHPTAPPDHPTAPPDHPTAPPDHPTAPPDHPTAPPNHPTAPPDHPTAPPDHPTAPPNDVTSVHRRLHSHWNISSPPPPPAGRHPPTSARSRVHRLTRAKIVRGHSEIGNSPNPFVPAWEELVKAALRDRHVPEDGVGCSRRGVPGKNLERITGPLAVAVVAVAHDLGAGAVGTAAELAVYRGAALYALFDELGVRLQDLIDRQEVEVPFYDDFVERYRLFFDHPGLSVPEPGHLLALFYQARRA
jgi:hypothetical protein